jgi:hypothetical protein
MTGPTDTPPDPCARFAAAADRVLDGELPFAALRADPHAAACPDCRPLADGVRAILGMPAVPAVTVPRGFADRVTVAAVRDRRRRRRLAVAGWGGGLAVAAAVLVAVWTGSPPANPSNARPPVAREEPPAPVPVARSLADAGSAIVSLSRRTADESLAPAFGLFAGREKATPAAATTPNPMEPLAELPQAAKGGVEPVTAAPLRALSLFVRDLGEAAGAGPRS